jgi:hypothetical protein
MGQAEQDIFCVWLELFTFTLHLDELSIRYWGGGGGSIKKRFSCNRWEGRMCCATWDLGSSSALVLGPGKVTDTPHRVLIRTAKKTSRPDTRKNQFILCRSWEQLWITLHPSFSLLQLYSVRHATPRHSGAATRGVRGQERHSLWMLFISSQWSSGICFGYNSKWRSQSHRIASSNPARCKRIYDVLCRYRSWNGPIPHPRSPTKYCGM